MLELNNVSINYGKFHLDVSMSIKKGGITGLIGPNGAGKSSTFKAILGLVKTHGGSIQINGTSSDALNNTQKADIGVVLADSFFSNYLTMKNIRSIMNRLYANFDIKTFNDYCESFSIPLDKKIKEFSTGMKEKAKLITALSHNAHLLILDEPTSGLDAMAREDLLDILRNYMVEGDRSILISSHISSDLEGLCDDLYFINDGHIILHEDTDILLSDYGIIKLTAEQYQKIDTSHIIARRKENFGYSCITNQKQFYLENYKELVIEKSSIDDVMTIMIKGEKL